MGILADFFISEKNIIPEYDCGPDFPDQDRYQLKGFTSLEAAGVFAVLKGENDAMSLIDQFELITPQDAEEWTMKVPDEMVILLSKLDKKDFPEKSEQCAKQTEDEIGWEASDFTYALEQLQKLASRAINNSKGMYFWNSL